MASAYHFAQACGKYDAHPLTEEQMKKLLKTAKGGRLEALLTLALTTGMRRGELLALHWEDIDFEERSLWVRHTVYRAGKYGIRESDPKTESSKRKIILPQFVIDALLRHRAQQAAVRVETGAAWQEHDIVFSNSLGKFMEGSFVHKLFKQLLKQAELPDVRFHDLRHTVATIMLKMGVHPKQVQELLGHSQIAITMDLYSWVLPSMQRELMDQVDEIFRDS